MVMTVTAIANYLELISILVMFPFLLLWENKQKQTSPPKAKHTEERGFYGYYIPTTEES